MSRAAGGGEAGDDVLIFKSLGAEPRRAGRSRRRAQRAEPGPAAPDPVSITRVTVIAADAFEDERAAKEWLEACRHADRSEPELDYALRRINRAVHAHRLATGDPYVSEVSTAQACRARLGYGSGHEVVEGTWKEAWIVPTERRRRTRRRVMLAPTEQVALILGGRKPPHPSEDLLLRARLDLEEGRTRQAALQAHAASEALLAELRAEGAEQVAERLAPGSEPLATLAGVARERPLDAEEAEELDQRVTEMERVARRRRHL